MKRNPRLGTNGGIDFRLIEDDGYCRASEVGDEYIADLVVGTINNTGTGRDGYANYTDISTIIRIDDSYEMTVTNGNLYSTDQCGTWIGWNQHKEFSPEERIAAVPCSPGKGHHTATISIRRRCYPVRNRMRIRIMSTGNVSPCGETEYGAVEDGTTVVDKRFARSCSTYPPWVSAPAGMNHRMMARVISVMVTPVPRLKASRNIG